MNFSRKKLSKDAILSLRRVPVDQCVADAIILTPLYIYLPKNQKFVAIKAPLQLLSPEELLKFKPYQNFYLSESIDQIVPFQKAGTGICKLMRLNQKLSVSTNQTPETVVIPLAQHETDSALLEILAPLWGTARRVEPFFLYFMANEVCEPFQVETLADALGREIEIFELALLRSSLVVFLALHIGYTHVDRLSALRQRVFEDCLNQRSAGASSPSELTQLSALVETLLPDSETREISAARIQEAFQESASGGKASLKLLSRLRRLDTEAIAPLADQTQSASIYGVKGFRDE